MDWNKILLVIPITLSTCISFASPKSLAGEREVAALMLSYPEKIVEIKVQDGEWALRIGSTWYYWAEGRLLPQEKRADWEEYTSYRFYNYPLALPPLRILSDEEIGRVTAYLETAKENPPQRYPRFLDAIYDAGSYEEVQKQLVIIRLFGVRVEVHEKVKEPLLAVDAQVRELAKSNNRVKRFLAGLKTVGTFNWRRISGTRSRSYHSYGIAVDLVPGSYQGKTAYWRWLLGSKADWWTLPYEKRWMIPLEIVRIFEDHGFIWGGKWLFFDTMHFEYRPEILYLAREVSPISWKRQVYQRVHMNIR